MSLYPTTTPQAHRPSVSLPYTCSAPTTAGDSKRRVSPWGVGEARSRLRDSGEMRGETHTKRLCRLRRKPSTKQCTPWRRGWRSASRVQRPTRSPNSARNSPVSRQRRCRGRMRRRRGRQNSNGDFARSCAKPTWTWTKRKRNRRAIDACLSKISKSRCKHCKRSSLIEQYETVDVLLRHYNDLILYGEHWEKMLSDRLTLVKERGLDYITKLFLFTPEDDMTLNLAVTTVLGLLSERERDFCEALIIQRNILARVRHVFQHPSLSSRELSRCVVELMSEYTDDVDEILIKGGPMAKDKMCLLRQPHEEDPKSVENLLQRMMECEERLEMLKEQENEEA
ncbi:hypothetical protein C8F01DRAFT_649987 [Mycena amicta]|nr:hypothetical protein C8F01DRAFT_649987 [Mycena amicta]